MIDYKARLDCEKLVVEIPTKTDCGWVMKVTYEDSSLSFKTPSLTFDKKTQSISFNSIKRGVFFKFLDDLESGIIEYLHKNSPSLFGGKTFTIERLKESLVTSWEVTDNGIVSLVGDCITEDTHISSPFDEKVTIDQLSKNVIAVISVDSITFQKSKFNINYKITHIKSKKTVSNVENPFEELIVKPVECQKEEQNEEPKENDMDFFNE